ncbi:MAG: DUF4230 domain-containing protein [Dysgonomonas sp.]
MKQTYKILILLACVAIAVFYLTKCAGKEKKEEAHISHEMVLTQIESLGNLQVVKYNIQDIVEYEKTRTFLPNSKTALIVVGEVTGCIDLTKIKQGDIETIGDSVSITLPDPEICTVKIDHSRSRVYNVQFGLWEEARLIDEAYAYAEKQIEAEARKMGIAVDCRENTQKVLHPILSALGFKKIDIRFKTPVQDRKQNFERDNSIKIVP